MALEDSGHSVRQGMGINMPTFILPSCFCADLNVENNVLIPSKLQSAKIFEQWKNTLPFYKNVLKEGVIYA